MAATRFVYYFIVPVCGINCWLFHFQNTNLENVETTEDFAITTEQFEITAQDITVAAFSRLELNFNR